MNWKDSLTGYFTFSRKDRIGTVALLFLIALISSLVYFSPTVADVPVPLPDSAMTAIETLPPERNRPGEAADFSFTPSPTPVVAELFTFDPNTLDAGGWRRLGLRDKTIKTIYNYRNKGGRFYKPEDLAKIWGLLKGFYEKVEPYISLPKQKSFAAEAIPAFTRAAKPELYKTASVIEINSADSSALIALPGIGSKLAGRIVAFRNRLGGFASLSQLSETYGLPDSTFQKIKSRLSIDVSAVKKININTVTKDDLKTHPYIKWPVANAMIAYRDQHGNYTSIEDVKKSMLMDEALFEKLKPYLSL